MSELLNAALAYARRGWKVFPLSPRDKVPTKGSGGFLDATTDLDTIAAWWAAQPEANVGVATGADSGFFVVDVDPRNGGAASLAQIPPLPFTLEAATGGGGQHYLFRMPDFKLRGKLPTGTGIDIKSEGGYIVAPPSVHPDGGTYRWVVADADVAAAPEWLLSLAKLPPPPTRVVGRVDDPNDDRPGSVYNRTVDWMELLGPAGWTEVKSDGEATLIRRPGKDDGVSASLNYGGSDLLWVWSTSTEFDTEVSYTKFGAYAQLHHGGDLSAAGKALAAMYSPAPAVNVAAPSVEGGPRVYSFGPAFPPEHFISRYIAFGERRTDAALEYHEAVGLGVLACVTPQLRARLSPYPDGLRTNLYLLLCGPTTRSRKSTAQGYGAELIQAVIPGTKLGSKMTTEVLINELSARSGLPSLWMPDEFGVALANIYKTPHLAGIEELLLSIYGGDDFSYTSIGRGTQLVHLPHLTVVGAATPESVGFAGPQALMGGLLPRFGIVFPTVPPPARPVAETEDLTEERRWIVQRLGEVFTWQAGHTEMRFSPDALSILNSAESLLVDQGSLAARLPIMLYKVATLSAASRLSSTVSASDASGAVITVLRWQQGAANIQPFLKRKTVDAEFAALCNEALDILDDRDGVCHRSVIAEVMRLKKSTLDGVLGTLVDWGAVSLDMTSGEVRRRA